MSKNNEAMVVFLNLLDLCSIKSFSFDDINKIYTNITKVIHLDVDKENINYFKTIWQGANEYY